MEQIFYFSRRENENGKQAYASRSHIAWCMHLLHWYYTNRCYGGMPQSNEYIIKLRKYDQSEIELPV